MDRTDRKSVNFIAPELFKEEHLSDKADVYSKIINNWKDIVGDELFDVCFPRSFNNIKSSNIKRLNIEVKRGREVDVEYARNAIIEKINKFLGYKLVNKIKLIPYKENKK